MTSKHCDTCTCGCTCGYGGAHEPENETCELNRTQKLVNARAHMDCYSTQDSASIFYRCALNDPDCPMGALSR